MRTKLWNLFLVVFMVGCFVQPVFAVMPNAKTPSTVTADKIIIDTTTGTARTEGKTVVKTQTGQTLTLMDANLNRDLTVGSVNDIEIYLSSQVRITAEEIVRESNRTTLNDLTYTACADKKNCDNVEAWSISAKRIRHEQDLSTLYFSHGWFYVYEVPVLWLPWFTYPDPTVKRRSGLLFPTVGSSSALGSHIDIPLYLNFSNYHDMTIATTVATKDNPLLQIEHRLNADHSSFNTTGSYTYNRDHENRWHIYNSDVIELGSYSRLLLGLNRTSDKTYLQEYGFYNYQPYLDTSARLEGYSERSYVWMSAHTFQELRVKDKTMNVASIPRADIIPNVYARAQTDPLFMESYLSFFGDVLGLSYHGSDTSSIRAIGSARYTFPFTIFLGQRVELSAAARYDMYYFNGTDLLNDLEPYSGTKNRFLPSGYVMWKWPFVKYGEKITQTIEPIARFVFIDRNTKTAFINQDSMGSLFNDTTIFSEQRFSGYDLWDHGSYMDYGVSWTAFDNANKNSIEVFVGQAYDFYEPVDLDKNSGFRLGSSDYVGRVVLSAGKWLQIYDRFRLNQSTFSVQHNETTARLGDGKNYVRAGFISTKQFDDAYITETSTQEIDGGFGLNVTKRWNVYAGARYNISDNYLQTMYSGVQYDHPCYTLGVLYKDDRAVKGDFKGNQTFQFRFALKINGDINDKTYSPADSF